MWGTIKDSPVDQINRDMCMANITQVRAMHLQCQQHSGKQPTTSSSQMLSSNLSADSALARQLHSNAVANILPPALESLFRHVPSHVGNTCRLISNARM